MSSVAAPNMLIIYTVGGTPEPIVASLKHHRPSRVIFVPSPQTERDIDSKILPTLQIEGVNLFRYEIKPVPDAQDFELCVKSLRKLEPEVRNWIRQPGRNEAAVDLTGGTKLMSAALALVARTWPCGFLYVGGSERNKGGVGVVVSGKEQIVHSANPWDSLGYQAIEEAASYFDEGDYNAAVRVAKNARDRTTNLSMKEVLQAFTDIAQGYEAWDRFDHQQAREHLRSAMKRINDLGHACPGQQLRLEKQLREHVELLGQLSHPSPTVEATKDLLANARRRARQGCFDDAVARLYRAAEAAAQIQLVGFGFERTSKVPLEKIPPGLQAKWKPRAEDGVLRLGLQDDYKLLRELGHPLGEKFFELGLDGEKSPLSARNQSILAHGFQPVGEKVYQDLWSSALRLADVPENSLPEFPRLRGEAA